MLIEKAVKPEGRISMLIVDKLALQEKLSEGEKTLDELQAVVTAQAGDYTLKE